MRVKTKEGSIEVYILDRFTICQVSWVGVEDDAVKLIFSCLQQGGEKS